MKAIEEHEAQETIAFLSVTISKLLQACDVQVGKGVSLR